MAEDRKPTPNRSASTRSGSDRDRSQSGSDKDRNQSGSDKERSRQQSRPVASKQAVRAGGGGSRSTSRPAAAGGGGRGPTGGKGRSAAAGRGPRRNGPGARSRATLFTWGTIALVIVVVVVLVVVKVFGSNTSPSAQNPAAVTPVPASILNEVTHVPAAVYDKVGVSSAAAPVTAPTVVTGTPALTIDGKPGVFYLGGEFCPYCAAERWAMITSLSRFGTFSGLGEMTSSTQDAYPGTQTFTFYHSTYTSATIAFRPVEHYSDVPDASTGYYTVLQPISKTDQKLISTYYNDKYLPGVTNGQVGIPFVDIGNRAFVYTSSSYSPSVLAKLSRSQIAAGLDDPTNPVTQAIIASSNYLSAAICATDGQQPASVCTSKGITAAAKALQSSS